MPQLSRKGEERNGADKVARLEGISEIAQRRKMSLDFDLEVMGNRKNIRVKDVSSSKSPQRNKNREVEPYAEILFSKGNTPSCNRQLLLKLEEEGEARAPCTFFKRFQEHHLQGFKSPSEDEGGLTSTKIKYNCSKRLSIVPSAVPSVAHSEEWAFGCSSTSEYRPNLSELRTVDTPCQLRREIKSSWNP